MSILVIIFISLGISIGLNFIFFIFAFIFKSDVFTDLTYALGFILVSFINFFYLNHFTITNILLLSVICLWALRLGSFLFIRIIKVKVDHRFDTMRNSFFKFGFFWLMQSLIIWITLMPIYINFGLKNNNFNLYSITFIVLALLFLLYESIADLQKTICKNKHKHLFINHGLWKSTRHPNYFGEYMFWIMIFIFSQTSNYDNLKWIGIVSPLLIMFTLYFASGLPFAEKMAWNKYGKTKEYVLYLKKTPTIIPFVGKKSSKFLK